MRWSILVDRASGGGRVLPRYLLPLNRNSRSWLLMGGRYQPLKRDLGAGQKVSLRIRECECVMPERSERKKTREKSEKKTPKNKMRTQSRPKKAH